MRVTVSTPIPKTDETEIPAEQGTDRTCAVGSGATACGISGAYELSRWNDPVGGVTLDSERAIDVLSKAPRNLYGGRSGLVALGSSAAARFILDHAGCEALVSQF